MFFFFQAEDGIRDTSVTGVQTCALPISSCLHEAVVAHRRAGVRHRAHGRSKLPGRGERAAPTARRRVRDRKSVVRERVEISGGAVSYKEKNATKEYTA